MESLVGGPQDIGGVMTYAGLFRIDERELAKFKENWGIDGALLGDRIFNMDIAAA